MWIQNFFKSLTSTSTRRRPIRRGSPASPLRVEPLEDRCLLSNYLVTDLGLETAADINNHGQVAGLKPFDTGSHAALWQVGTTIDLGALGGYGFYSGGQAISDAGHVAGYASVGADSFEKHAFLITPEDTDQNGIPDRWFRDSNSDGANDLMIDLGALGRVESIARDVNALGQVVGETYAAGPSYSRAFVWSNGVMTDLGTLGGPMSQAYAINDAGQVVGWAMDANWSISGVLINPEDTNADGAPDRWYRDTNGDGANDLMVVLPSISYNSDINASGQVVGDNLLWTPNTPNGTTGNLTDLGNFGASGLNGSAQVVGLQGFGNDDYGYTVAALWEGGIAVDLNTRIPAVALGLSLTNAGSINDQGWILASNENVPFLLTPDDQPPPPPAPPAITINDVTVTEGNTGAVNATFTVSLSVAYDVAVTVHYQTANGSATAGSDYAAASGDVIIAAGQTTKTFTVAVIGDRLAEPNETFFVNLSSPTNATIADGQGQGTIVDDEPRISISDVSKKEGKKNQTTQFTFTVTLSAAYDQAVTMSYATANGTATTSDSDYIAKTGMLTFAPGETTKTITIEVKGDSKKEADETFYLDLFGNSSNSLFTKNRGIGTILNDD
jgi:probable HAF family extracellular repeat protein